MASYIPVIGFVASAADALKNSIRQNAVGAKGETNGVGDLPGCFVAGTLQAGDKILLANGEVREIESIVIEHLEEPVRVYNFEVEEWHIYFVGEGCASA